MTYKYITKLHIHTQTIGQLEIPVQQGHVAISHVKQSSDPSITTGYSCTPC